MITLYQVMHGTTYDYAFTKSDVDDLIKKYDTTITTDPEPRLEDKGENKP